MALIPRTTPLRDIQRYFDRRAARERKKFTFSTITLKVCCSRANIAAVTNKALLILGIKNVVYNERRNGKSNLCVSNCLKVKRPDFFCFDSTGWPLYEKKDDRRK